MSFGRRLLVIPILLIPTGATAHKHDMEHYAGISAQEGSFLIGGHGSYEYVLGRRPNRRPLSIVADASINTDLNGEWVGTPFVALRYSYGPVYSDPHKEAAWSLSLQGLLGVQWKTGEAPQYGVWGVGAGYNFKMEGGRGWRVQADLLFPRKGERLHPTLRASFGRVWRR